MSCLFMWLIMAEGEKKWDFKKMCFFWYTGKREERNADNGVPIFPNPLPWLSALVGGVGPEVKGAVSRKDGVKLSAEAMLWEPWETKKSAELGRGEICQVWEHRGGMPWHRCRSSQGALSAEWHSHVAVPLGY